MVSSHWGQRSMQALHRDQFWDLYCFWFTETTFLTVYSLIRNFLMMALLYLMKTNFLPNCFFPSTNCLFSKTSLRKSSSILQCVIMPRFDLYVKHVKSCLDLYAKHVTYWRDKIITWWNDLIDEIFFGTERVAF